MITKPKTPHDVYGFANNCVNYQKCPLCFGCRRFNSIDPDCRFCESQNKKQNICNTSLHRDEVTSKMITKTQIFIDELTFESYTTEENND